MLSAGAVARAAREDEEDEGFVFAFIHMSRLEDPSVVERIVSTLVWDDVIHVAALPARRSRATGEVRTAPHAYTAFIFAGFCVQDAAHVLQPCYEFLFLPVAPHAFRAGMRFLESLRGARYNYSSLPLAVLPRALKTSASFPNWLTHEHPFFDRLLLPPSSSGSDDDAPTTRDGGAPMSIFCSQMGLLLCYACDALPHNTCDPAVCLPAELRRLLLERAGARSVPLEHIRAAAEGGIIEASAPPPAYIFHHSYSWAPSAAPPSAAAAATNAWPQ